MLRVHPAGSQSGDGLASRRDWNNWLVEKAKDQRYAYPRKELRPDETYLLEITYWRWNRYENMKLHA